MYPIRYLDPVPGAGYLGGGTRRQHARAGKMVRGMSTHTNIYVIVRGHPGSIPGVSWVDGYADLGGV